MGSRNVWCRIFMEMTGWSGQFNEFSDSAADETGMKAFIQTWMKGFLKVAREKARAVPKSELAKHPILWSDDPMGPNLLTAFRWLLTHSKVLKSALLETAGLDGRINLPFKKEDSYADAFLVLSKAYYGTQYTALITHDELRRLR